MRQNTRHGLLMSLFCVFPAVFYYMSPYLIVDGTMHRVITGSLVLFAAQFVSAIFLGRLFCGWACPAAGIQEATFPAKNRPVKKGNFVKWGIWIVWMATIVALAIRNHGYERVDPLYKTYYGISVSDIASFITYLMVLLIVFVPSLVIGKRSFCHHLCWMAPFMILGEKVGGLLRLPQVKLLCDAEKCVHCHACDKKCPMSVAVEDSVGKGRVKSAECVKCLACVDVCAQKAIAVKFTSH